MTLAPVSYGDRWKKYAVDWGRMPRPDPRARRQAEGNADTLSFLGGIAPLAGSAIGGLAGTFLAPGLGTAGGAAIGGALGGAAGQGLGFMAQQQTRPFEEEEMRRAARFAAVREILGSMR